MSYRVSNGASDSELDPGLDPRHAPAGAGAAAGRHPAAGGAGAVPDGAGDPRLDRRRRALVRLSCDQACTLHGASGSPPARLQAHAQGHAGRTARSPPAGLLGVRLRLPAKPRGTLRTVWITGRVRNAAGDVRRGEAARQAPALTISSSSPSTSCSALASGSTSVSFSAIEPVASGVRPQRSARPPANSARCAAMFAASTCSSPGAAAAVASGRRPSPPSTAARAARARRARRSSSPRWPARGGRRCSTSLASGVVRRKRSPSEDLERVEAARGVERASDEVEHPVGFVLGPVQVVALSGGRRASRPTSRTSSALAPIG